MKIVLFLLLAAAAALLFLLLAVLLLPLTYRIKGGFREVGFAGGEVSQIPLYSFLFDYRPQASRVKVKVFFIPFNFPLNPEERRKKEPGKKKPEKKKKENQKSSSLKDGKFITLLLKRSTLEHILSLVRDLLEIIRPKKLEFRGEVGLEEPHLSGWFLALLWSLKSFSDHVIINVEPLWDREHYDLEVNLEGRMIPGAVLFRLLKSIFSKKSWEIWRRWRRQKKAMRLQPETGVSGIYKQKNK